MIETKQGSAKEKRSQDSSPERIALLSSEMAEKVGKAITEIGDVNDTARLLSFNAQIEAARAGGSSGAAFAVVATAMQELSGKTADVAKRMASETGEAMAELREISGALATHVRGTRLSDLALTNIDLIDRNLYERSCDVRWWATDSSCVDALADPGKETADYCSRRLGVILNSYTVYKDLVLCNLDGKVIANGSPRQYKSVGHDCSGSQWFREALAHSSGEEFGFQAVHASALVSGQRILAYSCGVREKGDAKGRLLGVLGILFDWDSLAQNIVHNTPIDPADVARSRVCIIDSEGEVLADSKDRQLEERLELPDQKRLLSEKKNFVIVRQDGKLRCIAHAHAPGYETYSTGWHSVIIQDLIEGK